MRRWVSINQIEYLDQVRLKEACQLIQTAFLGKLIQTVICINKLELQYAAHFEFGDDNKNKEKKFTR